MRVASRMLLISPYWNVNQTHSHSHPARHILLISPYWNVNEANCHEAGTWFMTFNLSILECKLVLRWDVNARSITFNLSILECKSTSIIALVTWSSLLISPYWNVNVHGSYAGHRI